MRRKIAIVVIVMSIAVLAASIWPGASRSLSASASKGYIDVHTHLLGRGVPPSMRAGGGEVPQFADLFSYGPPRRGLPDGSFRKRPGGRSGASETRQGKTDYDGAAASLISRMDQYGVEKSIIMPPPMSPENRDSSLASELIRIAKKYPGRLYVGLGGSTLNSTIQEYKDKTVTDEVTAQFTAEANRLAGLGIKVFGEMTALHFSLGEGHPFEEVSPDHPLFLLLADIAARSNIPIDLHMTAIEADMPLPERLKQNRANPATIKENITAFERLLTHNRSAKIVWQHIGRGEPGVSGSVVDLLRRLLNTHSNLYMAIAIPEQKEGRPGHPARAVDEKGTIRPEWKKLLEEFPDRFMIGTDQFSAKSELQGQLKNDASASWNFLSQLPADLAQKISRDNAERVYFKEGKKISSNPTGRGQTGGA
ncbi:MAG: amidohydrolase family protein [Deltaproteobacteria bacterium]|nr:amidohydrolase family protein [Deltaproteobacteria bacterium]